MSQATGAVGSVDALAAGPCGPHEIKLEIAVPHTNWDLTGLRQYGHAAQCRAPKISALFKYTGVSEWKSQQQLRYVGELRRAKIYVPAGGCLQPVRLGSRDWYSLNSANQGKD